LGAGYWNSPSCAQGVSLVIFRAINIRSPPSPLRTCVKTRCRAVQVIASKVGRRSFQQGQVELIEDWGCKILSYKYGHRR